MSKPLNVEKILQEDRETLAKALMTGTENTHKGLNIHNDQTSQNLNSILDNDSSTIKLNVDPEMQKRLRAMKYINSDLQNSNKQPFVFAQEKLQELKVKQEKDNKFFKTLNYAQRIKEVKKKELLSKVIQDNHKNCLNISLIMGQPFYFNFVVYNNSENDELLHIIVTKSKEENNRDDDKNEIGNNFEPVSIVNSPEEWRYITEKNEMVKPNDYECISAQNYLIVKPNESIPILVRTLSFDESISNSNYCVYLYKKTGEPLSFLSITIVKVFPIIDHIFSYFMPENRLSTIKFPNSFKYDKMKTQQIIERSVCSDVTTNLQLDTITNEFYFKFKTQSEGFKHNFYIFIYFEPFRNDLFATWKFDINSMAV
jgi:hypothetical protein